MIQIDGRNALLHGYAHTMRQAAKQPASSNSISRVRVMAAEGHRKPLHEHLREALSDGFSAVSQAFGGYSAKNTNPMCKNYGHVIDRSSWTRGLPRCQDCGATVSDAAQLRKAIVQK